MRFKIENDRGGHPTWWLYASNGQLVAWAGQGFYSLANARRAAAAFAAGAHAARWEVYRDGANAWRWRAWRGSDKVAASGEAFATQSNAVRAANNVRDNVGRAAGLNAA